MNIFSRFLNKIGYVSSSRVEEFLSGKKIYTPSDPTWELARLINSDQNKITSPYKQHPCVFACVKAIATNIASTPFYLYRGTTDKYKRVESGVLYNRFMRPNSLWTRWHLWEATVSLLKTGGNAIWLLKRESEKREPSEILVFGKENWSCETNDNNQVISYKYKDKDGKETIVAPHQVVHFRQWNPDSNIWGMGDIEAARLSIEQDYSAALYNKAFFENSAIPGALIEFPEGEAITSEQWKQIKESWGNEYGGPQNAFKLKAITGGAKFTQISLSQKDMLWIEQRKWGEKEIREVFKVPPSELGDFENVHKATSQSVDKQFWQKTLIPLMRLIEDTLRAQFFLPFDNEQTWGAFDLSGVEALQDDLELKANIAKTFHSMGVPLNQIIEKLDLPFETIPGGDVGYLPIGVFEAGTTPPISMAQAPPQDPDTPKKAMSVVREIVEHSPAQKLYWKEWVAKAFRGERGYQEDVRTYLNRMKKWLAAQIETISSIDGLPVDLLRLSKDWDDELIDLTVVYYDKIAEAVGPLIERHVAGAGINYAFNVLDPKIVDFMKMKAVKVVGVNDSIREGISVAVQNALRETQTVAELQETLYTGVMSTIQDTRARSLRIARTETGQAANGLEYESYQLAGIKTHQWLAALDEVTRETHVSCMAQGDIPVGTPFINGLRYPGDTSGSAGEVVNCRCTLMAVT